LRVAGIDTASDRYEDALYEAGCDDALVAVVNGSLLIDFDREAPNFDAAVTSATRNVEKAGGRVIGVEPVGD
jgi:hypothetical protein